MSKQNVQTETRTSTSSGSTISQNISRQSTRASLVDIESTSSSNASSRMSGSLVLSRATSRTSLVEVKEAKQNTDNTGTKEQATEEEDLPDLGTLLTELRDSLYDFPKEAQKVNSESRASKKAQKASVSRQGSKTSKSRPGTGHSGSSSVRPESGKSKKSVTSKQSSQTPMDPKSTGKQPPETIIRIENECEKLDDGTTVVQLNEKFLKKRKQYTQHEKYDPDANSYNMENEEKRAYVIENMLMSTFHKRENEFYRECKEKARQERWKAISQQIRIQIQKQIQLKTTLNDYNKKDKKEQQKKEGENDMSASKSTLRSNSERPGPVKQAFV